MFLWPPSLPQGFSTSAAWIQKGTGRYLQERSICRCSVPRYAYYTPHNMPTKAAWHENRRRHSWQWSSLLLSQGWFHPPRHQWFYGCALTWKHLCCQNSSGDPYASRAKAFWWLWLNMSHSRNWKAGRIPWLSQTHCQADDAEHIYWAPCVARFYHWYYTESATRQVLPRW